MNQTLYIDESGYTGEKYLTLDQPEIVFSSVKISNNEANQIVGFLKVKNRLQGKELKGKNLVKTKNGRKAILELLEKNLDAKIVYFNKVYSLCGKFYETLIDATIPNYGGFLYERNFQRYFTVWLYDFLDEKPELKEVFLEFEFLLRGELNSFEEQLMAYQCNMSDGILFNIITFLKNNITAFINECERGVEDEWLHDLSLPCVFNLLSDWGPTLKGVEVMCDKSKPLESDIGKTLNSYNSEDQKQLVINKDVFNMTYNFEGDIQFGDSKKYIGLQIADILASSFSYALKNKDSEFGGKILKKCSGFLNGKYCVGPDYSINDVSNIKNKTLSIRILELLASGGDVESVVNQ